MISARAANALVLYIALFERKHLRFLTVHRCGDSIRDLIGKRTHWIGRALNVAARHGQRLMSEEIAYKKGVRARLGRKGPGRMPEIVRPEIS